MITGAAEEHGLATQGAREGEGQAKGRGRLKPAAGRRRFDEPRR